MRFVFDEQALGELYRREGSRLLVFFVRRTYDAQLSLDLVGETFARAFERRERFRGSSEAEALSWVWSIARTTLADSLRRGRAERRAIARLGVDVPRLSGEEVADVERRAGLDDLRVLVEEALAGLSREHREALRLRVVMELDYAAVAARLGISQATARARVSRGLRALAASLDIADLPA